MKHVNCKDEVLKIKKLNIEAIIPKHATHGDAGLDLTAISVEEDEDHNFIEYGTGLAMEIPDGHVGLLFPRSSISKKSMILANSVGVIDSGYRGEVKIRMRKLGSVNHYNKGDRVAQLIILKYPTIVVAEADELTDTPRSYGGFGSSGE